MEITSSHSRAINWPMVEHAQPLIALEEILMAPAQLLQLFSQRLLWDRWFKLKYQHQLGARDSAQKFKAYSSLHKERLDFILSI